MWGLTDLLCVEIKRSVSSMLPWDIPWYDPSHAIFFAALYGALAFIVGGVVAASIITMRHLGKEEDSHHH